MSASQRCSDSAYGSCHTVQAPAELMVGTPRWPQTCDQDLLVWAPVPTNSTLITPLQGTCDPRLSTLCAVRIDTTPEPLCTRNWHPTPARQRTPGSSGSAARCSPSWHSGRCPAACRNCSGCVQPALAGPPGAVAAEGAAQRALAVPAAAAQVWQSGTQAAHQHLLAPAAAGTRLLVQAVLGRR